MGATRTFTCQGYADQKLLKTWMDKLSVVDAETHARRHSWTSEIASEEWA